MNGAGIMERIFRMKIISEDIRQHREDLLRKRFRLMVKQNKVKRRIIGKLERLLSWILRVSWRKK